METLSSSRGVTLINTKHLAQQAQMYQDFLQKGLYFEAHEALEELWFDVRHSKDDEVRFVRALINAAVSFELIKRKRLKSALKPWDFYEKNLHLFQHVKQENKIHYTKIMAHINEIKGKLHV